VISKLSQRGRLDPRYAAAPLKKNKNMSSIIHTLV